MKKTKKNKRKSIFDINQSFDLFEGQEILISDSDSDVEVHKEKKSLKMSHIILGAVIFSFFGSWMMSRFWPAGDEKRFIYMELRALTPKGNPLAGAEVIIDSINAGKTDSFGEWRRYLPADDLEQIKLTMEKNYRGHLFRASKLITVPAPVSRKSEAEIKMSLTLRHVVSDLESQLASVDARPQMQAKIIDQAKLGEAENHPDPSRSKLTEQKSLPENEQKPLESEKEQFKGVADANNSVDLTKGSPEPSSYRSSGVLGPSHLAQINVKYNVTPVQYGSVMEKHQSNMLRTRIVPELLAQMEESGVKVSRSAKWLLEISYIPYRNSVGFVKADITWPDFKGKIQKSSFIMSFAKTIEETANNLALTTKSHVAKTYEAYAKDGAWYMTLNHSNRSLWNPGKQKYLMDPFGGLVSVDMVKESNGQKTWKLLGRAESACNRNPVDKVCMLRSLTLNDIPPVTGWKRATLRFNQELKSSLEVYIAGFKATSKDGVIWQYWADPKASMNITVIKNTKVISRRKFKPEISESPQFLTLKGLSSPELRPKSMQRKSARNP